ncbi:MAG: aminotransferase class III-fold pyridoxal phosphate-dependent enzyme [Chitinophagaceae bacterium]|nr:aminotransferase class III-fold pyridoxal phosphate-dependent enzyme [Chitinophagaceae bacterium]
MVTAALEKELCTIYGINAARLEKLEGYGSVNYLVTDTDEKKYVLKVYTNQPDFNLVKEEIRVLNSLCVDLEFYVPQTIPSKDGNLYPLDKNNNLLRLLHFIDGEFLYDTENSSEILYSFGRRIAQIAVALSKYDSAEVKARKLSWDLQYFYLNFPLAKHIADPSDRKLVNYFFDLFQQVALDELPYLRHGLIHGDLHDLNVLVENNSVSGLIDFGDISYTPLVADLAIALTYVMLNKPDPITPAVEVILGYHSVFPLEKREVALLPHLITTRLCISLSHSAEAKTKSADTEYILISEKPAWQLLRQWISLNPVFIENSFMEAAGFKKNESAEHQENILSKRIKYFGKSLSLSYSEPIYFSSAAFQYMYDGDGNTYLDAYNNIPHVGHSHPNVSVAASKQIRKLNTNTRYYYDSLAEYAEKLLGYFPQRLNKIFFVNSGSAATDLALRMANTYTKSDHHIVLESGYHGHTLAGINVSSYKFEGKGGRGVPGNITRLPLPKLFNGTFNTTSEYVENAKEEIDSLSQKNIAISSFIFEPTSGCGGQVPLPGSYLKNIFALLGKNKSVTICDEVQTGFGRLGNWFWGFEMHNVVPDMVLLGKPMGNGHPVAAVVTTEEIADKFANGMEFFSSFGGSTVSAEIAMAVLQTIEEEKLQEHAKQTGYYFVRLLQELQKHHPCIGDVRGCGLFLGIEFITANNEPATALAKEVKEGLKKRFILTGTDGKYDNVIKIKPPMCFSKENANQFCEVLNEVLKTINY